MVSGGSSRGRGGGSNARLLMAGAVVIVSLIAYFGSQSTNPATGDIQHIGMTPDQEIAMGLQAAPLLAGEFGGHDDSTADQARVQQIGLRIVYNTPAGATSYQFDYHLLADTQTVNAFALPGGQIFVTRALYDHLQTDGELAGVLAHQVGHVVARHSAGQIARSQLTQGLSGAAVIAACDPHSPNGCIAGSEAAAIAGQLITMRFSRAEEAEADWLGVCLMHDGGYDPQDLVKAMQVIDSLGQGPRPPEFLSMHPDPGGRIAQIQHDIQDLSQCP